MQKDRITEWFGGCCEDEELGVGRKLTEPSREPIFDPGGNDMTLRQPEAAGKVRGAPRSRELKQGKRVPVALCDDLITDGRIEGADQVLQQQGACVDLAEWPHAELRQPSEDAVADHCSSGTNERHPLGEETAGDEAEDLRLSLIEPLCVVDDARERPPLGHLGEQ